MADLELIVTEESYEGFVRSVREGIGGPVIGLPSKFRPCLLALYSTYSSVGEVCIKTIMCTISEAKRIVYPKTNLSRGPKSFCVLNGPARQIVEGHIRSKLSSFQNPNFDRNSELQVELVTHTIEMLPKDTTPDYVLITDRVFMCPHSGTMAIDFSTVTRGQALSLVHWRHNYRRKARKFNSFRRGERPHWIS